ncbi:ATP-binding protein [Fodinicola feengrottensis]|uniref:ATP-binding protein n=1 Tax=Fodinicola feengrottensis TaxID=435914 RepID=UPI0013CF5F5F|nr:hypothetical protein [Fodinicola feengrottensis]
MTLVGPGGAGKTALALAAAELVAPDHAYGVVVIECGRLPAETAAPDGPNLVAEALRSALDAPIGRESPLAATAQILQGQQRLIVFDNAEHVRRSCARLVDHLSRSCPRVRHLVTSRHQLGLPAETVWEVEPLPVPAAETWQSDQIAASPAVQLFTRLARQIRPRLDVASQLTAVAGICRDLGGLPLAIELATARLRAMSISDLADRLTANQAVLTATADHRLPHQHTLQSTFEWSEQLLPPAERLLLARLAVFPATFDLAAAEQVCGHDPLPVADIAPLVTSLVDHSMMQTVDSGTELHYRLLPPIREFAPPTGPIRPSPKPPDAAICAGAAPFCKRSRTPRETSRRRSRRPPRTSTTSTPPWCGRLTRTIQHCGPRVPRCWPLGDRFSSNQG